MSNKDYLFLAFATLLLIFVTGAFWFYWGGTNENSVTHNSYTENSFQNERNIFDCNGDKFTVNQPVSSFTFREVQHKPEDKVVKDCRWLSDSQEYNIVYLKMDEKYELDQDKSQSNFGAESSVDSSNPRYFRETQNGYEVVTKGPEAYAAFSTIRFGYSRYFLGFGSSEKIDLNNGKFRSFVDSFKVIN